MYFHRESIPTDASSKDGSGTASNGAPVKKCPGVNALTSVGSSERGSSGRELRHASTCARSVLISSNVSALTDDATEVIFSGFDCGFPQSAEVGSRREVEVPLDALVRDGLGDAAAFGSRSSEERLKLAIRADKIRTAV
jgi:hypothetical protein